MNDRPTNINLAEIERRLRDDRPDESQYLGGYRPSTLERIADALQSERFLFAYLGFYAGCAATVVLAWLWSLAL